MARTSWSPLEHVPPDARPGVVHALIGAAIGVAFIYLGAITSYRLVSWLLTGLGVLFVIVMVSFTAVVFWQRVSGYVLPYLNRARGYVLDDPQLGTLTRDVRARCWVASLLLGGRTVEFVIDGDDEPLASLLHAGRELLAQFDAVEHRVAGYLAREAEDADAGDPQTAAEIRALRIRAISWRTRNRPADAVIDFEGPDEMRYWTCEWVNGEPGQLTYDS